MADTLITTFEHTYKQPWSGQKSPEREYEDYG